MAGIVFAGFDSGVGTLFTTTGETYTYWIMPNGVYSTNGHSTLNKYTAPATVAQSNGHFYQAALGVGSCLGYTTNALSPYTSASSTTRASYVSNKGMQVAFDRAQLGIGNEIYATFDLAFNMSTTLDSTYQATNPFSSIFRWGDVAFVAKSTNYAASELTITFAVLNNNVEIATFTVPSMGGTKWSFASCHVKLDESEGIIEFYVDGFGQSAPFIGNTIQTLSLAETSAVHIGPIALENAFVTWVGAIDSIYLDDSEFPPGRPYAYNVTLLADDSTYNFKSYGPNATTMVAALASPSDNFAVQSTAANGCGKLSFTSPPITDCMTQMIGMEIAAKRVTNRDSRNDQRLALGIAVGGVETIGMMAQSLVLKFANNLVPPIAVSSTVSTHVVEQIFKKSGGSKLAITDLASTKLIMKSVDP